MTPLEKFALHSASAVLFMLNALLAGWLCWLIFKNLGHPFWLGFYIALGLIVAARIVRDAVERKP